MPGKRLWKNWPKQLTTELNSVSGIAGVGGTALSVAGWTAVAGTVGIAFGVLGIAIAAGALGHAIWKSIPPQLQKPEDLVGQNLSLDVLAKVHPPIPTLGIVGPSRAGKTTLKSRLSLQPTPTKRTQVVTAYIAPLVTTPVKYIAILDGGGESYAQQFAVAAPAEIICAVLDHNSSDTAATVDAGRMASHSLFMQQMRGYLSEAQKGRAGWVHLLLNKRDLWETSSGDEKATLSNFFKEEVSKWQQGNWQTK
jgi:Ethanolamine utilisation - propanediol utilisation